MRLPSILPRSTRQLYPPVLISLFHVRVRSMSSTTPPTTTTRKPPLQPLILILGATGTGKSALALSICAHLSRTLPSLSSPTTTTTANTAAEILNADAMQLYRGLPVITNKLPVSQQQSIPHHLLDLIPLEQEPWTVHEFVRAADEKIAQIRARGGVPVVVGGTGYYARALVWRDGVLRVGDGEGEDGEGEGGSAGSGKEEEPRSNLEDSIHRWPILDGSSEEMHAELARVDPEMARRWHPRDRRKIQRSLEICLRSGRRVSEIYREQAEARERRIRRGSGSDEEGNDDAAAVDGAVEGQLRYDPLVLWLSAEDAALKDRLNTRVGDMVRDGLLEEALELQNQEREFKARGVSIDKSKGIWVSIGYKEMERWAEQQQLSGSLPLEEAKQSSLAKKCLEAVRAGTRRYAKRQERYIRIVFAKSLAQAGLSQRLMLLDGTDLGRFYSHLVPQAEQLVTTFLDGKELPEPSSLSELAKRTFEKMSDDDRQEIQRGRHYCDVCDKAMMSNKEWQAHVTGNGHKKVLQGRRRHQQKLEWLQRAGKSGENVNGHSPLVDVPS